MRELALAVPGLVKSPLLHLVLRAQAVYYVLTGLWPLAHIESFEWLTGPKLARWLVYMVGLLAASIGVSLWVGAAERRVGLATIVLAATAAASFTAIDVTYVLNGRISQVYLLDAAAELLCMAGVLAGWLTVRRPRPG